VTQEPWLNDVAVALADGRPIDWAEIDARPLTDAGRAMVARFRLIERVVQAHVGPDGELSADLRDPRVDPGRAGAAPNDDEAGITWGPLTILQRIGGGTYGDVYRAHDRRLDRIVALKLLRRRESGGEERESAVIEEGRLLARVRHPNVVTVHGAERIDGRVGLWMEFIEGQTLAEEVRMGGPRSAAAIAKIGIALCGALTAVHEAGLLHHDLKAQNVMRTQDGRIVLTDFGAGQDFRGNAAADPPQQLTGTPAYLAPEVMAGQPATVQSEVYSLGVLLFYLSTGTFPVRGRALQDLREAHGNGAYIDVLSARADMPPALTAAITRCLTPTLSKRFQSMHELADALGAAVTGPSDHAVVSAGNRQRHAGLGGRSVRIVLASTVFSAAAAFLGSYAVPNRYRSEALIYVEPQRVPQVYVTPAAEPGVADRVQAIRQQLMSRTKLEALIKELALYEHEREGKTMEDLVERTRQDIAITIVPGPEGIDRALNVSFTSATPESAQKVTDRLSDLVINESMRNRENLTEGTDQFIEATLDDLNRRLAEHELKLQARSSSRAMMREYEELQTRYKKLISMREDARTRASLERRSLGAQFRLLDQARIPDHPISPNRWRLSLIGALAGLGLGLALIVLPLPRRILGLTRSDAAKTV
jgi:serine/threonine protein kinase